MVEQARNKRSSVKVLYKGSEQSLADVCEQTGVNYYAAYHEIVRLDKNPEDTIEKLMVNKEPPF